MTRCQLDKLHDLIVVSDLHLGEGKPEGSSRWASTEDFFHDEAFARFLDHVHDQYQDDPSGVVLVLNGDIFDFLTVTSVPTDEEASALGFEVFSTEHKFGLNATEAKSIYKLDVIFRGHQAFFRAVSRFIARGHRVEIIRGNHDLEIHFEGVRARILEHLASFSSSSGGADMDALAKRVRFHHLFYLEEGRLHVEHGHQYDSTNSIRYPTRPLLSRKSRWWRDEQDAEMLDYPIGSIFVKYFYNRVRKLDPYAPRLLSPEQYMDFIQRYNFFDVWRVYRDHYPHFIAALGPSVTTGSSGSSREGDADQTAKFEEMATETGTGNLFRRWNDLKIHPESASKPAIVRKAAVPVVKRLLWFGLFAFVALYLWLLVFQLIQTIPVVAANAFLMSVFAVVTFGGIVWIWVHLQKKLRPKSKEPDNCAERAGKLGDLTGVPLVLMGHTHNVDHRVSSDGRVEYANSGTWTSVGNPWNRLMRDARRLTFLHVVGKKVHLRRWNDDAGRFDDVPLFRLDELAH